MSEAREGMLSYKQTDLEPVNHNFSVENGYLIIHQVQGYNSKIIGRIKYEEVEYDNE